MPICNHVSETSVILVAANSQFNTLEDLVAYAKDHPGELKASTNGNKASNHIAVQLLSTTAGFEYTAIPYGGTADQLLALRQGEVDFSSAKLADFAAFTSEVKVLGVFIPSAWLSIPTFPLWVRRATMTSGTAPPVPSWPPRTPPRRLLTSW